MKTKKIIFVSAFLLINTIANSNLFGQVYYQEEKSLIIGESTTKAFSGTANIKLAIVSNGQTIWSNDGSSQNGEAPVTSFQIQVQEGNYQFDLGAAPMKPVFTDYLEQFDALTLKTWIDIGNGFYTTPDRMISMDDFLPKKSNWTVKTDFSETKNTDFIPKLSKEKNVIDSKIANKGKKFADGDFAEAPRDRFKMRWERKVDEDGNIPYGKILKAKEHIDAMKSRQASTVPEIEWEWLGPGNVGGRIRTIIFHPDNANTMWIGAASGGIWKTTNGGNHWFPIDDFLPSLNVTSLVMDPSDPNIMYAATGEGFGNVWPDVPGAGIFKSVDGGNTWNQLESTNNNNFRWVTRLAHDPIQPGVLLAATRQGNLNNWSGSIYKSTDGGESWQVALNSVGILYDIKYHKTNPSIIFVGTSLGLLRSINNGDLNTWIIETSGAANKLPNISGRVEIAVGTSNPNAIYVSLERNNGEIWRSLNAGETWTLQNTGINYCLGSSNQCWYDNAIWVNPMNHNRIVVGGIDLWRSNNGGVTLTQISRWQDYHNGGAANSAHADQHFIIEHPGFDNNLNRIVYFGNDGGIQRADDISTVTTNNGWTNLANNLGITQFYAGAASPSGDVVIGGSQDNSFMFLSDFDGTSEWIQPLTGDGAFCAVDYTNSNILYSSFQNLRIRKSIDRGQNWTIATNGISEAGTNNAPFIAPFVMDPNNPQILVAGSHDVYRTTNGAVNWVRIRNSIAGSFFVSALAVATGNSQVIWAGYVNGTVSVTTNSGTDWINVAGLPNRWVNAIAINPSNQNEVIVAFAGYQDNNLWRTINGGTTWTQITGAAPNELPALPINTITFHPGNTQKLYIGTDLGIFVSENSGASWNVSSNGTNSVNPANVEISQLFWAEEQLIAATYGRGMFKTSIMLNIYVDKNAPPGGNGTLLNPFNTVNQAINAAGQNSQIFIFQGVYDEAPVIFNKKGIIQTMGGKVTIE